MTSTTLLSQLVEKMALQPVLVTIGCLVLAVVVRTLLQQSPLAHMPLTGQALGTDEKRRQQYLNKASILYQEGYRKVHRNSILYQLLPPTYAKSQQFKDGFRIITTLSRKIDGQCPRKSHKSRSPISP